VLVVVVVVVVVIDIGFGNTDIDESTFEDELKVVAVVAGKEADGDEVAIEEGELSNA
jgi:hypothetical protein